MVEFRMFILVSEPLEFVTGELEGVLWWMFSKFFIYIV